LRFAVQPARGRIDDTSNDHREDVRAVVTKIGLDPWHTSITRMLLKGIHTAIVAKAHDTSEAMIRRHYAAAILDHTDAITRQTLPSLETGSSTPAASNVVPLAKGTKRPRGNCKSAPIGKKLIGPTTKC
jgi:hypothetical protein